jgi:hypothetical protein
MPGVKIARAHSKKYCAEKRRHWPLLRLETDFAIAPHRTSMRKPRESSSNSRWTMLLSVERSPRQNPRLPRRNLPVLEARMTRLRWLRFQEAKFGQRRCQQRHSRPNLLNPNASCVEYRTHCPPTRSWLAAKCLNRSRPRNSERAIQFRARWRAEKA